VKIFVTVGTQLAFDRLIRAVDQWIGDRTDVSGFAQIGPGVYLPQRLAYSRFVDAGEFRRHVVESSLVIAHAGMGSILTALEIGKPIIVLPRRAAFGEHRNDHQIATARSLQARGRAVVAFDERELLAMLRDFDVSAPRLTAPREASKSLIDTIRAFIHSTDVVGNGAEDEHAISGLAESKPKKEEQAEINDVDPVESTDGEEKVVEVNWESSPATTTSTIASTARGISSSLTGIKNSVNGRRGQDAWESNREKGRGPLLRSLSCIVLLDGAVTRRTFSRSIGRSTLELPISDGRTVMDHWLDVVDQLRRLLGQPELCCKVVVGHNAKPPQLRSRDTAAGVVVERDPSDFRGTGGLLHDIAKTHEPDEAFLVVSAGQILHPTFFDAFNTATAAACDAAVLIAEDESPTSCVIATRRALDAIPPLGFIDLKEQGLALMGKSHRVRVISTHKPIASSIRTPSEYLAALRLLHGGVTSLDEEGTSSFSIVEAGAAVAESASLHDAVILAGGRVDSRAFVASSIVCTSGTVPTGGEAISKIVTIDGAQHFDNEGGD
jgi:UDP-N-acetylglucosamine transferase subunit ALG13